MAELNNSTRPLQPRLARAGSAPENIQARKDDQSTKGDAHLGGGKRFLRLALRPNFAAFVILSLAYVMQLAISNPPVARVFLLLALVPIPALRTAQAKYAAHNQSAYNCDHDQRLLIAFYLIGFLGAGFLHLRFGQSQQAVAILAAAMVMAGVRLTKRPKFDQDASNRPDESGAGIEAELGTLSPAVPLVGTKSTSERNRDVLSRVGYGKTTPANTDRKRTSMSKAKNTQQTPVLDVVLKPLLHSWINQIATLAILMGVLNLALIFGYAPHGKGRAVTLVVLLVTAVLSAAMHPNPLPAMAKQNIPQKFWVRLSIAAGLVAIPIASAIVAVGAWPLSSGFWPSLAFAFSFALVTVPIQLVLQATHNFVQVAVVLVALFLDVALVIWKQDATGQLMAIQAVIGIGLLGLFYYWGSVAQATAGLGYHLGMSRPPRTEPTRRPRAGKHAATTRAEPASRTAPTRRPRTR